MKTEKQLLLENPLVKEIAEVYAQVSFYNGIAIHNLPRWDKFVEAQEQIKEWEILQYNNPQVGGFVDSEVFQFFNASEALKYRIYKVKRLSDGEVFTLGDVYGVFGPMTRFVVFGNRMKVEFESPADWQWLSGVSKISKNPLFVTTDGKDIYDKDTVWLVTPKCEYSKVVARYWWHQKEGFKTFSTLSAAEEYVLMNKPCLSVNEVLEIIAPKTEKRPEGWIYQLTNLAKQK
jgi:hypothetical protein